MKYVKLSPCKDGKYPYVPDLKFYQTEADGFYFNATYFLHKNPNPNYSPSVEGFFNDFNFWIYPVMQNHNIMEEDVCVSDNQGNIYIEESFALLFMIYVQPWLAPDILERIDDIYMYGVTLSDSLLDFLHKSRFEMDVSE